MISKFDFLLVSHAKPQIGTFNSFFAYAKSINKSSNYKVALIFPSFDNDLKIRSEKINKNLYFISLPCLNYHKYFNLQLIRLICLFFILLKFEYKSILASGFSQPQIALPITLIKILKKKKIVYLWDDVWGNGLGLRISFIVNKVFLICERISLKFCDHVIYPSSYFKKKISAFKKPSTKIYQPYIEKNVKKKSLKLKYLKKKFKIKKEQKIIVCMGNAFFDTENIILKSLNNLKDKIDFKCIFVGRFEPSKKNRKKFSLLLKNNIINVGFVRNKIFFNDIMNIADLYILPMARNIIEKSRFPVRILDYLNREKIIVSNATGELKYLFKKYNLGILTQNSFKSFSKGIKKGLNYSKKNKNFFNQGQHLALVSEFNYRKTANKLIGILK